MPDTIIPTAFNTIDDQPFDDGHPCSSWSGRELIHNDRLLHAICRKNLLNMGWDIRNAPVFNDFLWHRVAIVGAMTSPGIARRSLGDLGDAYTQIQIQYRGVVPLGDLIYFAVGTRHPLSDIISITQRDRYFQYVGTGAAAANWSHDVKIDVMPSTRESVQVWVLPSPQDSSANDNTGILTAVKHAWLIEDNAVPNFTAAGVARGDVIRLEHSDGRPLGTWHSIIGIHAGGNEVTIWPPLQDNEMAGRIDSSGVFPSWRSRAVSSLTLRSLAIDEVQLAGSLL